MSYGKKNYQVYRDEGYSQSKINNIVNEADRRAKEYHNNVDTKKSYLNDYLLNNLVGYDGSKTFDLICKKYNAVFNNKMNGKTKKIQNAIQEVVITASPDFFKELGWVSGQVAPDKVKEFFKEVKEWIIKTYGYRGGSDNFLLIAVHYDEETPHLQAIYVPLSPLHQEREYERDIDGNINYINKIKVNKKTGETKEVHYAKTLSTKYVEDYNHPSVSINYLMRFLNGHSIQGSYSKLQDSFNDEIGKRWGLDRGEINSGIGHETTRAKKMRDVEKSLIQDKAQLLDVKPKRFGRNEFIISAKELETLNLIVKNNEYGIYVLKEESKTNAEKARELKNNEKTLSLKKEEVEEQLSLANELKNDNVRLKKENKNLLYIINGLKRVLFLARFTFQNFFATLKLKHKKNKTDLECIENTECFINEEIENGSQDTKDDENYSIGGY